MGDEFIAGRNSVLEALKGERTINKVFIAKGERHGSVREIIGLARSLGLVVQEVDQAKLDTITGGLRHQGVVAMVAPVAYVEVEDIPGEGQKAGRTPVFDFAGRIGGPP